MRLDPLHPNSQQNFAISKIQDGGGGHLKNSKKTQYLRNGTTVYNTSGSAIAEGPRDVLVSRNSATTKISLSCGIICVILRLAVFTQYRSVTDTPTQTDGQIHDDGMYCA